MKKKDVSVDEDKKEIDLKDSEPNWYHYVIVIIVFFLFFYLLYLGFNYFNPNYNYNSNIKVNFYNYPYQVGNITYNIQFSNPIDVIKNSNYTVQVNKLDILNSQNLTMSFYNYTGTDNGYVTIAASKIGSFLHSVYFLNIDQKMFNVSNCSTSSINSKVIMFNPNSSVNGVLYNQTNGCIQVDSTNATNMVMVGDKLIYTLINS